MGRAANVGGAFLLSGDRIGPRSDIAQILVRVGVLDLERLS